MTRRNTTTDKVRAVFLATLMVVSVFGGTVTLAGSAAATANSSSFAANVYAGGEVATISVTDSSAAGNNEKIEELEVTVESREASDSESVTLEETAKGSGTFEGTVETAVVSSPDDLEMGNGLIEGFGGDTIGLVNYDASAILDAKAGAPSITDADVVGMRDGNTTVRVDFSEPVRNVDARDFEFTGSGSVEWVTPDTAQDGYVVLTFDREIQTGTNDAKLVVSSESYSDLAGIQNAEEDRLYVDSVELNLDKGMNFVSAPFETGGVGFDAMKEKGLLDNVDVVWAYDRSSPGDGHWVSYDPDAEKNQLEWFRGGQGYVFVAEKSDEIDVRSFTKYADNADSDNVPAVPETEQIEPGWNLVGHYHEGSMSVDTAFGFGYDTEVGVFGQAEDGSMQYVGEADIGEGYWVFTRGYGLYTPKKDDGGSSTSKMELSASLTDDTDGNGLVTSGDTITVDFTATDDDGLYSVHVGASKLGADYDSTYFSEDELESGTQNTVTFEVSEQNSEPGEVVIPVIAEDVYGEEKTKLLTVDLDDVSPTVDNFAPTDGAVANSAPTELTFDVSDDGSGVDESTLSVSVSDSDQTTELESAGKSNGAVSVSDGTVTIDVTAMNDDLADGEVTVEANVDDAATNTGSGSATFTLDTASPTVDNFAPSNGATVTSADSITFDVSDDTSDVDTETLSVKVTDSNSDDGAEIDTTGVGGAVSYDSSNGQVTVDLSNADVADGSVTVEASVDDVAGNSDSNSATFTLDSTSPSVSDVAVADNGDGDEYVTDSDTVSVSATVTDETSGVDSVSVDASALGGPSDLILNQETDTNTYSATFDVGGSGEITAEDGDVSLTVTASDVAGNEQTGSDSVTLDTQVDTQSVSASASNDAVTVTIEANEELNTGGLSAPNIDGQSFSAFTEDTEDGDESIHTYTAEATGVSDGTYNFDVSLEDANGNTATASVSATVDNVQPTASWADSFQGSTVSGTVDLTSHDESTNADTTTYEVDSGSGFSEVSSTWDSTQVIDGDVTVRVTVEDNQGNSDSATATVTVDNSVDTASINSPTQSDSVIKNTGETLTVNYDANDANYDSATVELADSSGNTVATASGLSSGTSQTTSIDLSSSGQDVTAGTYSVKLTVTDSEGNSKTVTETDAVTVDDGNVDTVTINSPTASSPTTVSAGDSVTVDYNANDANFDSATVELVDSGGTTQVTKQISTAGDSTVTIDTTGLAADDYDVVLTVNDAADNSESTTEAAAVTVDDGNVDTASINSPTESSPVTKNTGETLTVDYDANDANYDSATVELVDSSGNTVATASGLSSGTGQTTTIDLSSSGQDVTAGTYSVKLTVTDSAGNSKTVTETDAVTVDDGSAPSMSGATQSTTDGTTTVTVTLSDDYSGLDSTSIEQADFSVDTGTISSFDASGISDGANTGDVTITLDADYSGQDITVSLTSDASGISDMAGNSATSGSATATSN